MKAGQLDRAAAPGAGEGEQLDAIVRDTALLRLVMDAVGVPLVFVDGTGRLLYRNRVAAQSFADAEELPWGEMIASWTDGMGRVRSISGGMAFHITPLVHAVERDQPSLYVLTPMPDAGDGADPLAPYRLTAAERDVLDELIGGRTPVEIAHRQGVSIATVRTHIARLHDKFGVGRTVDVIRVALKTARDAPY